MKFGIKCLQENAKERHYSKNYFFRYKTTLLQKQQLYMIQSLSYKKLSGSKQQLDFQIFTKFLKKYGKFSAGWAA